jgi:putative DNA primase/helicase
LIEIPEFPRYWTQDCTPEALAVLTSKHGERMAVLSDEGGYFDILAGRYSRGIPNLDFVLQAHAGAPVRVDRKSGDTVYLAKPLLTIGVSPQPAVLSGLSDIPGFRGRGLLARFMYGLPPSNLGYRHHEPESIPLGVRREWNLLIRRLLKLPTRRGNDGAPAAIRLTFAASAYDSWHEFQKLVEVEMREGNRLAGLKDWSGKLPGAAVRIAGIFHCAMVDPTVHSEISRDTAEAALALASILISHATCVFGLMGSNPHVDTAKRLIRWASDRGESQTTKRDTFCAFQSTFKSMDNLEPVLRLLTEYHYVRTEERSTKGRPSPTCIWNPAIFGGLL